MKDMNPQLRQSEDSKGRLTPAVNAVNVLKKRDDLEGLDRDVPHSVLCKKAEKLSAAVYLVTGFLSDNEPMKWQIRESSLKILSDTNLMRDKTLPDRTQHAASLNIEIGRIFSLFEISVMAGFVSDMNFAVLREEYHSIIDAVSRYKIGEPQGRYIFAREFFSGAAGSSDAPTVDLNPEEVNQENLSKGHEVKDGIQDLPTGREEIKTQNNVVSGNENSPKKESVGASDTAENLSVTSAPRMSRQVPRREIILQLIKGRGTNGELSIKDIVGHVPECGEKTVQRELGALVAEGVLKKTGDRRWSRYSLIKPETIA
ncbi:MAG: hypothetical protein HYT94_02050 [Parcubacteria group bacterium]|nr:hypothetical protein [Parcubacteria group bacterium]